MFRSRVYPIRTLHDRFDCLAGVVLPFEDTVHRVARLHPDVFLHQCREPLFRVPAGLQR